MVRQIGVRELRERLNGTDGRPVILDVREPWEFSICALPGSTHIPLAQIPARLGELRKDGEIVVVCHYGIRSQHVAGFLQHEGYDRVYNLRGGIDAWANEVDPIMAKY